MPCHFVHHQQAHPLKIMDFGIGNRPPNLSSLWDRSKTSLCRDESAGLLFLWDFRERTAAKGLGVWQDNVLADCSVILWYC